MEEARGAPSSAPVKQLLALLSSRCCPRWPSRGRPHRSCQCCAATAAPCALTSAYASSVTPPPRRPVSTNHEACEQAAPSVRDAGARGWNSGQRSKSPQSGALAWPHLGVRARRNSLSMGPLGERSLRGRFRAGPRARTTGHSEISESTFGTHFPPPSGRTTTSTELGVLGARRTSDEGTTKDVGHLHRL